MDIFGRFARDPSCLLAIDAADGGTWRSPFRGGVIYPSVPSGGGSFETRTGLITKTNIKTSNGYFEAGNTAIAACIDTPLDLRGRVSSYTSIVRFTAVSLSGYNMKQELAGQGPSVSSAVFMPICALSYIRTGAGYHIQLSQEIAGSRAPLLATFPAELTGIHVVAGVVDVRTDRTVLSIYLDGLLILSGTYPGRPTGNAHSTFTNYAINDNRDGAFINYFGRFYNVLLFGRALRQTEIQLLR